MTTSTFAEGTVARPAGWELDRARRRTTLAVLVAVYAICFGQRQLFSILAESIKRELGLSDTTVGLLGGAAFAVVHALAGVPIAGLTRRMTRRGLLLVGLVAWTSLTTLTGLAGSVLMLALLRAGLGISQAACVPPSHSLIADRYPLGRRATAISIYSLGIPIGTLIAFVAGGWLDDRFGWRATFLVAGVPGILLAILVVLLVEERPLESDRGRATLPPTTTAAALRVLLRVPSFRGVCVAGSLRSFAVMGVSTFIASYFVRMHGWHSGKAGLWLGLVGGVGGGVGTYAGGALADALSARAGRHWNLWLPALGTLLSLVPLTLALTARSAHTALLFYFPYVLTATLYIGPTFSVGQAVAPAALRTVSAAAMMSFVNLVGFGLGPQAVGLTSDLLRGTFGDASIRYALLGCAAGSSLWAALQYFRTGRSYARDVLES
jgi:predicted MFS family arabinose efflux permease